VMDLGRLGTTAWIRAGHDRKAKIGHRPPGLNERAISDAAAARTGASWKRRLSCTSKGKRRNTTKSDQAGKREGGRNDLREAGWLTTNLPPFFLVFACICRWGSGSLSRVYSL